MRFIWRIINSMLVVVLMTATITRAAAPQDCEHDRAEITVSRGIIFEDATGLVPGQYYWKLIDAAWCDPIQGGGVINIFYRCLDENGNQITNQPCITNYNGTNYTIYTKAPPDWGDFPMSGGNWCPAWPEGGNGPYNAWVDGAPSDKVYGMGLPCNHHESYYLTWQWTEWSSPTTGAIAGVVENSGGVGIVGATVTVQPGNHTAESGAGGNYAILDLDPGTYSVTASKVGFNPETVNNVQVTAGSTTDVDFTLGSSLGTVSGIVQDTGGQPIAFASITLSPGDFSAITDTNGSYQMIGVPPDTYSVTAFAPGKNTQTMAGQTLAPNGSLVVDFSLPASGRVVHLLDDFNGDYPGFPTIEESFKGGVLNHFYWRESLPERVLSPNTGSNSSQGFGVITNNDQDVSWFETEDLLTGDHWFNLVYYAQQQGWEPIDLSRPITFLVYVKGQNLAADPDDTDMYWRQQLSLHHPSINYAQDSIDWNSFNAETWQMLRVTATGLQNNQNQWLTFEHWMPSFYESMTTGTSWVVWDNFMVEYAPFGLPDPVSNFTATPGNRRVQLAWDNPSDPEFQGTRVRYRTDTYPVSADDGVLLADVAGVPGESGAVAHLNAAAGQAYYYAAFAFNGVPQYAPPQTATAIVPAGSPGDFDRDGDVDSDDFGHFQVCLTGPGAEQADPDCQDARLDGDVDVDQDDYQVFAGCMSGPNVLADLDCAE